MFVWPNCAKVAQTLAMRNIMFPSLCLKVGKVLDALYTLLHQSIMVSIPDRMSWVFRVLISSSPFDMGHLTWIACRGACRSVISPHFTSRFLSCVQCIIQSRTRIGEARVCSLVEPPAYCFIVGQNLISMVAFDV